MQRSASDRRIELRTGDITKQDDLDAVVNAANAELMPGGGVAGAIHRAAGTKLAEACRPLGPIRPGEAIATDAFAMPNQRIVHCLGPIYGHDEPADKLLAACYRNALRLTDQEGLTSIGFPAISTGAFGYPLEDAAEVAIASVTETMKELNSLTLVRFVLFDEKTRQVFEDTLMKHLPGEPA